MLSFKNESTFFMSCSAANVISPPCFSNTLRISSRNSSANAGRTAKL